MSGYGTGAVISPTGNITYPWWCFGGDWYGMSADCRTATEAEIRAAQAAELGPAAMPTTVQTALDTGDAAVAAYQAAHPEEYAAYLRPSTNWPLWIGVGVVAVLLLTR